MLTSRCRCFAVIIIIILINSLPFEISFSQTEIITNGNFSSSNSGWVTSGNWHISSNFNCNRSSPAHAYAGNSNGEAVINEYGDLKQTITIPNTATSATFSFYVSKSTDEIAVNTVYDYVNVYLLDGSGNELLQFSPTNINNLYAGKPVTLCDGFSFKTFSIPSSYFGSPVQIDFRVHSDGGPKNTMFRIDDVSVLATIPSCTAVTIATQPQDQTANAGSTATFSVSVNGTSPYLYFWYKGNTQIQGASSFSYTTPTLTASDNGNTYKCIITNCNNNSQAVTNNARLTVNSGTTPSANFSVSKTSISPGETITTTNNSTGNPAPTYSWSASPSTGVNFTPNNTANQPSISFSNTGNFTITLTASNSAGSNQTTATIYVTSSNSAPTANFSVSQSSITAGETITTTNNSIGTPTPTYSWSVVPSTGINFSPGSTAINPSITFTNTGTYTITLTATNDLGANQKSSTIVVTNPPTGIVDTWPIAGNELVAEFQSNSEFILNVNVASSAQITNMVFTFSPDNGTASDYYTLTVSDPNNSVNKFEHVNSYTYTKQSPITGNWKIKLQSQTVSGGPLKLHLNLQSSIGKFQTINYRKIAGKQKDGLAILASIQSSLWSVTAGLATGVCSDDDDLCDGIDGIIGLIPIVGQGKSLIQSAIAATVSTGMGVAAFITNDEDTKNKAADYLASSMTNLAAFLLEVPNEGAVEKIAIYGPRLSKLLYWTKQSIVVGDLYKTGTAVNHIMKNISRSKFEVKIAPPHEAAYYFDKTVLSNTSLLEAMKFLMASKLLTDPFVRFNHTTLGGDGDGINVQLWAKPEFIGGRAKEFNFDYSTVRIGPKNGPPPIVGYEKYGNMDIVIQDLITGKKVVNQITLSNKGSDGFSLNSPEILKIKLAVGASETLRSQMGIISANDVEILGIVGREPKNGPTFLKGINQNSSLEIILDSSYFHQQEPTIPYVDRIKLNSNNDLELKFHTITEFENKGWLIKRASLPDTVFITVSPLLYGWTNSDERHDYVFTDESFDTSKTYKYLIEQLNIMGFTTFVSDTFIVNKNTITTVDNNDLLPTTYCLYDAFPNPFNPITVIRYDLPIYSQVTLKIYNALGQEVKTLVNVTQDAGYKSVEWNASDYPSGLYFFRVDATGISNSSMRFGETKKMILLK